MEYEPSAPNAVFLRSISAYNQTSHSRDFGMPVDWGAIHSVKSDEDRCPAHICTGVSATGHLIMPRNARRLMLGSIGVVVP